MDEPSREMDCPQKRSKEKGAGQVKWMERTVKDDCDRRIAARLKRQTGVRPAKIYYLDEVSLSMR